MEDKVMGAVAAKLVACAMDPIMHVASAIFKPQNIIQETCEQHEKLQALHNNLKIRHGEAISKGEEIIEQVNKWFEDTKPALAEVETWKQDSGVNEHNISTCACIFTREWIWAYKQRKNAKREKEKLCDMINQGEAFSFISRRIPAIGITLLAGDDFIVYDSVRIAFEKIMTALRNPGQGVIGIYGMGGVGKTTLLKKAVKEAEHNKLVSKVVVTVVSQTPNVHKIQAELGDELGMMYTMESENGRATQLSNRMNHEDNILVVLDDVWRKIDLATIGIPIDHKGCKVLLSSRLEQVCRSMDCHNPIELSLLNEEESLDLFERHAGTFSIDDPQLKVVQTQVARECDKLPLALIVVGSALKGKSKNEWEFALKSLKNARITEIENIDENDVYARIKLSYDFVPTETTKRCFLMCSLFPEDYEITIEELTRYVMGYGLFDQDNPVESYQDAVDQVKIKIDYLLSYNLLLRPYPQSPRFQMHDMVRDAALWITSKGDVSKGEEVFLVPIPSQKHWTKGNKKLLVDATAISLLAFSENQHLPNLTECSRLKMLLMAQTNVPDTFFNRLTTLQVLDMTAASKSHPELVLPSSLQHLCSLRTLYLRRWRLKGDMSIIGSLTTLEILSFAGSVINKIPLELLELSELMFLDLSDCTGPKYFDKAILLQLRRRVENFRPPTRVDFFG